MGRDRYDAQRNENVVTGSFVSIPHPSSVFCLPSEI